MTITDKMVQRAPNIRGISARQLSDTAMGEAAIKLLVYRYESRGMTTELATQLVNCGEIRLQAALSRKDHPND